MSVQTVPKYARSSYKLVSCSPDDCRAGPSGFQGSAQGMEGIDESSQNDDLILRAARTPSTAPRVRAASALQFRTQTPPSPKRLELSM